ncbi:hypothetical protein VNI00_015265 [Paramarasmius palmivorus]|uniref:Uncharacterized protein n=1 Tax=Paramarasmius palmivorus TaxID=297713 RepID=A0AAW0BM64_9AGAR
MTDAWYPNLGELAFSHLLSPTAQWALYANDPSERDRVVTQDRIQNVESIFLDVFTPDQYIAFRQIQAESDALVVGASALGCAVVPDPNAPVQVAVGMAHIRRLLRFCLDANLTFHSNLPEEMRHGDPKKTVWLDLQYSNTGHANKTPYTPTVDDDRWLANVFRFETEKGKSVEIMLSNGSSMDVVLGMQSTLHLTIVTARDILMAYPKTTLDLGYSLDARLPHGASVRSTDPSLPNWDMVTNPHLNGYDVVAPRTELTLLPRYFGDRLTLRIPLTVIDLPSDPSLPGSRESIALHSWQLRFGPDNDITFESSQLVHPSVWRSVRLCPTVHSELSKKLASWGDVSQGSVSLGEDDLLSILHTIYVELASSSSTYVSIIRNIRLHMATWANGVPKPGVSYVVFRILSNLQASFEDRVAVDFLCVPPRNNRPVLSKIDVIVLDKDEPTRIDGSTEVYSGMNKIHLLVVVRTLDGTSPSRVEL